jgi:predicted ribosomally synthesized peptide with nif11-like leader
LEIIMAKINRSELTKKQLEKALECKTAEELIALAKTEGFDITKDEADAYLAEMANFELDSKELDKVAGGTAGELCWTNSPCPPMQ